MKRIILASTLAGALYIIGFFGALVVLFLLAIGFLLEKALFGFIFTLPFIFCMSTFYGGFNSVYFTKKLMTGLSLKNLFFIFLFVFATISLVAIFYNSFFALRPIRSLEATILLGSAALFSVLGGLLACNAHSEAKPVRQRPIIPF